MTGPEQLPPPHCVPALDDATREQIRGKARQIARRAGLAATEVPDLEQDLALHLWPRLRRYQPAKGPPDRFVRMLLAHAAATALRARRRLARRAAGPLGALLGTGAEPAAPAAGPAPGLALDVAAVLARLPRPLRRTAEALKARSVTDAARHLRVSRPALYRRLAALRAAFVAAGLDPLGPPPDTSPAPGVVPW